MKKSLIVLIVMLFAFESKSQQTDIRSQMQPSDYIKKSKKQRNTGFILLGGGVTLVAGGSIAMEHSNSKGENEVPFIVGGLLMTTASIPFFISSGINKHKAKVYMKREALMLTPNRTSNISYNSIGLRLNI